MLWNEYVIRNRSLDANEKEMLSVLLSFEDGSDVPSKKSIYYYCSPSNVKTNDNTFRALKKKGHIKLIKNIDPEKHKIWWDYEVYQKPLEIPVPTFETVYTTAPMVAAANPDLLKKVAEKYGIDPSVLQEIQGELSKPVAAVVMAPIAPAQAQQIQTFFDTLTADSAELQRIATKYELATDDLQKHLENFKANKRAAAHTDYVKYSEHFDNYVAKCLQTVKQVIKNRTNKDDKKKSTPSVQAKTPTLLDEKDESILLKTRQCYAEITRQEIPFSEYREQVDMFIQYATECEKRKIGNDVLTDIHTFFAKLRKEPGALRAYYDKQQQQGSQ